MMGKVSTTRPIELTLAWAAGPLRRLCVVALGLLLFGGCAGGPATPESVASETVAPPVAAKTIRIVLVGDSTVTDQSGWGAGFKRLLDEKVECVNYARSGRSSKSFIEEGHWEKDLADGADYVLIQFGHNDMPGKGPARETDPNTTYRQYMSRYVDESRAASAVPVLVTSMTRRNFREGKIATLLGDYAQAVRDLAREKEVPLVDLHAASIELLNRLGPAESEPLGPMVNGRRDRTHLSPKGQAVMAALVADLLRQAVPQLAPHLKNAAPPSASDDRKPHGQTSCPSYMRSQYVAEWVRVPHSADERPRLGDMIPEISDLSIYGRRSSWSKRDVALVGPLKPSEVQKTMDKRNSKYDVYRQKCHECWLIIVADRFNPAQGLDFSQDDSALTHCDRSRFERVFFLELGSRWLKGLLCS
jgi:lysophospholipase L1-like esterase